MAYYSARSTLAVRTAQSDKDNFSDSMYVTQITGDLNDAHNRVAEAERRVADALRQKEAQLVEQLKAAESQLEEVKIQKDAEYQRKMDEKNAEIDRLRAELASQDNAALHEQEMSELDQQIEALKQAIADEKAQRITIEIDLENRRAHIRTLTESLKSTEQQYRHDKRLLALFRDAHSDITRKVDHYRASRSPQRSSHAIS